MGECWNQFRNVLPQVGFREIAVPASVIQADMNSGLEKVVLTHDRVEKRLHIYPPVLVSIKLQECRGTEKMPELQWEFGGNSQKGVIVEPFLVVVGRRKVFPQQLVKLL